MIITIQEVCFSNPNDIESINTEKNKIHPILSGWDAIDILYIKPYN